jgi:predicted transcriptional regulator
MVVPIIFFSQFSCGYCPLLKTYEKLSIKTTSTQVELQKGSVEMGKLLVQDTRKVAFMSPNMSYGVFQIILNIEPQVL